MSTPKIVKPAVMSPAAIKNREEFILWITDFFHGHWEDPSWGTKQAMYQKVAKMASERAASKQ